ncbi:MAG: hypothetical protein JO125_16900 [Chloroflexi bacterium]|nr:hypothetical protein [Ktedonobacteraceae bacterium]MBV9709075.1 hypothetical protein [Chloroflexota bacterium]
MQQSDQQQSNQQHTNRLYQLYANGLFVVSFVILQGFLSVSQRDVDEPIFLSVLAFAISLPLLSIIIVLHTMEERYKYGVLNRKIVRLVQTAFFVGIAVAVLGIDAALWHISWVIGIVFFAVLVVVIALIAAYVYHLHDHPGSNNSDET